MALDHFIQTCAARMLWINVLRMGTASWAPMKMPAVSTTEAKAVTMQKVLTSTWMGPFVLMDGGLEVEALE